MGVLMFSEDLLKARRIDLGRVLCGEGVSLGTIIDSLVSILCFSKSDKFLIAVSVAIHMCMVGCCAVLIRDHLCHSFTLEIVALTSQCLYCCSHWLDDILLPRRI